MSLERDALKAIKESLTNQTSGYESKATVTRIENGVAYVHIPGGVSETPASFGVGVKEGDEVYLKVDSGKAVITGNVTAPPTDDTVANQANQTAQIAIGNAAVAKDAADSAVQSAATAQAAADSAVADAAVAKTSADSAIESATNAGKAASIAQKAADATQEDLEDLKTYFYWDEDGAHVCNDATNRTDVTTDGMDVVKDGNIVASFGQSIQLGEKVVDLINPTVEGVWVKIEQPEGEYGQFGFQIAFGDFEHQFTVHRHFEKVDGSWVASDAAIATVVGGDLRVYRDTAHNGGKITASDGIESGGDIKADGQIYQNTNDMVLDTNMIDDWIDLTNSCDYAVTVTKTGNYRSFIKYNPYTHEVKGVVNTSTSVANQGRILTLPNLTNIGTNSYTGLCGACVMPSTSMLVNARVRGNIIYSSHTVNSAIAVNRCYMIDFVAE